MTSTPAAYGIPPYREGVLFYAEGGGPGGQRRPDGPGRGADGAAAGVGGGVQRDFEGGRGGPGDGGGLRAGLSRRGGVGLLPVELPAAAGGAGGGGGVLPADSGGGPADGGRLYAGGPDAGGAGRMPVRRGRGRGSVRKTGQERPRPYRAAAFAVYGRQGRGQAWRRGRESASTG